MIDLKRILITGENSYIGVSFENYIKQWSEEYKVETVDMIGDAWKSKDFAVYDVIYHVAGIAHSDTGKISKEKERLYYAINTDLTIEVARKAKREGVKQFIFMSSAIVYGESAGIGKSKMIGKDTPVTPSNCYGDSKVQAELGILPLADDLFKIVILRPPMIYGKGSKGNYQILARFAKKLPVFPYIKNQRSMLYIENLLEFVRLMIKNEESGIFWPQNSEYSNTSELVAMIAGVQGKKILLVKGFGWGVKILGMFIGMVNKAFGNLSYEMGLSEYKVDYRVVSLQESVERTERQ